MGQFRNNLEHLTAELAWLNLLIRGAVSEMRFLSPRDQQEIFKGVFISDAEIDQLLRLNPSGNTVQEGTEAVRKTAGLMRKEIGDMRKAAIEAGIHLALPRLAYLFGLTAFEEQVLLVCLAVELDLKYERFYAYLQDDVTRKKPTIGLVIRLLCPTEQEKIQARMFFSEKAPLVRLRILSVIEGTDTPILGRSIKLDEAVASFLLGAPREEGELSTCATRMTRQLPYKICDGRTN